VTQSIGALLEALHREAPGSKAASWDPVGLQLGDPAAPAERVAVCHEVTDRVVAEIERDPVDLLVSYHPLLFQPTRRLVSGPGPEGRALRLVRSGAGLAVVHTNFDAAPGGTADALATALGLGESRPFGALAAQASIKVATFLPEQAADAVLEAVVAAGAARIGNYTHCSYRVSGVGTFFAGEGTSPVVGHRAELNREPEVRIEFAAPRALEARVLAALVAAHPYEEPAYDVYDRRGELGLAGRIGAAAPGATLASLAASAREALGAPALRVAGDVSAALERVAVVPGAGEDLLELAAAEGAHAIVTGDVRHHRARAALDRGLAIVDPGHAATERPGVARLLERVAALSPGCRSLLAHDPDPWLA
jgi:dinuclear metal center YbgI/SA1388 family protein